MIKNRQTHLDIALFHQNFFCLITQDPYLYTQVPSEIRFESLNQKNHNTISMATLFPERRLILFCCGQVP